MRGSFYLAIIGIMGIALSARAAETESARPLEHTKDEKAVLKLINAIRAKEKLPELKPNALLIRAARDHSRNMVKQKKLAHVLDGKQPHERVSDTGYQRSYVGENIANGPSLSPAAAVKMWINSPPHKANILGENFEETGIGLVRDPKGTVYYTQVFAKAAKSDGASKDDEFEKAKKEILKLTNEARAKEKLPALKLNGVLSSVARGHSMNMAKQEKMEHVLDGKTPQQRVDKAGYDYAEVGENIATNVELDVAEIFDLWMKSKVHRDHILGAGFKEIGIGLARGTKGDIYYTQVFGTERKKKK